MFSGSFTFFQKGATCYMNALVQCLFHNRAFRDGVYCFEPSPPPENPSEEKGRSTDQDAVIRQLRLLFVQLEKTVRAVLLLSQLVCRYLFLTLVTGRV